MADRYRARPSCTRTGKPTWATPISTISTSITRSTKKRCPRASSTSTTRSSTRIKIMIPVYSRRGIRPIGRFTTTYRGPAAIFADRFRIVGFSGRPGSLSLRLSQRLQRHRLYRLHLRRQRSGDNTALDINRRRRFPLGWRSIFFSITVVVDHFVSQSR